MTKNKNQVIGGNRQNITANDPLSVAAPDFGGLHCPDKEHSSCGVGFVASLKPVSCNTVIKQSLQVLVRLAHRGGVGADPGTGDGAGILCQIPDKLFRSEGLDLNAALPPAGQYAVAMVMLPRCSVVKEGVVKEGVVKKSAGLERGDLEVVENYIQLLIPILESQGFSYLGRRIVPTSSQVLGEVAKLSEPLFVQFLFAPNSISEGNSVTSAAQIIGEQINFGPSLLAIRRKIEKSAVEHQQLLGGAVYITSLSEKLIVYKGLLCAEHLGKYFSDLESVNYHSQFAVVHQRYSTNTFPSWALAQPFRFIAHNGEINTLRGNLNWLSAREQLSLKLADTAKHPLASHLAEITPVITPGLSDSASLDALLELLYHSGRSLPHCLAMAIPEAWEKHSDISEAKRAFYQYHSCLLEPWDGPASVTFTDGRYLGAVLDRNGLRPSRWLRTVDGTVLLSSEAGVLDIPAEQIEKKGRLEPGKMLLLDLAQGVMVSDEQIKGSLAEEVDYSSWVAKGVIELSALPDSAKAPQLKRRSLARYQRAFGYSEELLRIVLAPMATRGEEAIGSMGSDTPLAVFSRSNPLLFDYFKQLFAQVTNPPLDAIREGIVTSTSSLLGAEGDLLAPSKENCRRLQLKSPVLSQSEMAKVLALSSEALNTVRLSMLYSIDSSNHVPGLLRSEASREDITKEQQRAGRDLELALHRLCRKAARAVRNGATILVLSDRKMSTTRTAIPSLLACGAVHHYLIKMGLRTKCSLVMESGEPREVHHVALLCGYGASAVHPYLALESVARLAASDLTEARVSPVVAQSNYLKALDKGILKVMSKMGISTFQSYHGAQIFEAVGISMDVIESYFCATPSRIGGATLGAIALDYQLRHRQSFPDSQLGNVLSLPIGGEYQWRRTGTQHLNDPNTVAKLQIAVRESSLSAYRDYANSVGEQSKLGGTIRGLLDFVRQRQPISIDQVEPASNIVQRFRTGAMSFGSISMEAHSNLALAMNRLRGLSNSGEGGEDPLRYYPFKEDDQRLEALRRFSPWFRQSVLAGDSLRSGIKQVASGRFGVTSEYLVNADELQIKIAQGAKPGEGGQLPGHKVDNSIARVRHSTPGVSLISPPPHHDIYSIEDIAQLIFDLKNANRYARVSVKLVSAIGVGTVAAGVAKAKADVILISGGDGGTGASPLSSIKYAGLPWELGLAEAHQVLVANGLRGRVRLEVDGQLKTGRDVAIACLLGAEEFGFATAPLIASGCVMMRKCHLNTCPVGIATQDPILREKFPGKPEHVINFMFFVAEELREVMAELGFSTVEEMIGRNECLTSADSDAALPGKDIDWTMILAPEKQWGVNWRQARCQQEHGIENSFDVVTLLPKLEHLFNSATSSTSDSQGVAPANARIDSLEIAADIYNTDRAVGAVVGSEITRKFGGRGLTPGTVCLKLRGSAGQSFAAFTPRGMHLELTGEANDYFGKGLSGATLVLSPNGKREKRTQSEIIIGNVALYGATSGEAYIAGRAGERFAVRNSGAYAVVEGVGDHGCEYMTGGRVVVLGPTGRNFAAGMSGGIAYVLDQTGDFSEKRCNHEFVDLETVEYPNEVVELRTMIAKHVTWTGSQLGQRILWQWDSYQGQFIRVIPRDYKRLLLERSVESGQEQVERSLSVRS